MGHITNLQHVKHFMRIFKQEYSDKPTDSVDVATIKLRLKLASNKHHLITNAKH